jgi:hypothetical protein
VPFGSTFAGTPPGVKVTSLTGLPEISTSRPPTWNEPISRSAIGSAALASVADIRTATAETIATRIINPPIVVISLSPPFAGRGVGGLRPPFLMKNADAEHRLW